MERPLDDSSPGRARDRLLRRTRWQYAVTHWAVHGLVLFSLPARYLLADSRLDLLLSPVLVGISWAVLFRPARQLARWRHHRRAGASWARAVTVTDRHGSDQGTVVAAVYPGGLVVESGFLWIRVSQLDAGNGFFLGRDEIASATLAGEGWFPFFRRRALLWTTAGEEYELWGWTLQSLVEELSPGRINGAAPVHGVAT